MTPDEMRALAAEHAECEHQNDWPGALATMVDDGPFYEVFPCRLRISGPEAILAWWLRFGGESDGRRVFDDAIDPASHHVKEYLADDALVQVLEWDFIAADGERRPTSHVAVFGFRDGRILSESIYCDVNLTRYMDRALDERFRALPGVTQM